jgi:CheY-like chemotaxis protein/HPt (histidine-containing phosphotransfer) domain-containing protein
MTRVLLTRQGHTVELAGNGQEAVEMYKANRYDLIFMDVQMPEMDGFEASQMIRELEAGVRHTPIIAMTAHALHGDRQRCIDAGMDDYVSKPLDPRKVFQSIDRWAFGLTPRMATGELRLNATRPLHPIQVPGLSSQPQSQIQPQALHAPLPPAESSEQAKSVAKPSEEIASSPDVILDVESALVRFSDDRNFYYNLLEDFLRSLPARLAEMWAASGSGNVETLSNLAHNLKGVAANFSAWRLARLAAKLDECSRIGNMDAARPLIVQVEAAAGQLENYATALLEKGEGVG